MMKKSKNNRIFKFLILSILLLCCTILPFSVNAKTNEKRFVVLGGDAIGLKLETDVYVTGMYEVTTDTGKVKPWINSNVLVNDIIVSINNKKVTSINDIKEEVSSLDEGYISIKVKRNEDIIESNILVVTNVKGENTIGLYVKDKVLGVGTLTYYDLNDKTYGALGHLAINQNIIKGTIYNCNITGITKGLRGQPGEKQASIDNVEIGNIEINNKYGIFGTINNIENTNRFELIEVAKATEVKNGKAYITTVIEGNKKEVFEIEIIEVKNQFYEDIKGIKFKVTDKQLLDKTGGIIQGMSGSPIVQDGKLVGAVSHVLINDSAVGYGVFCEWMLNYS